MGMRFTGKVRKMVAKALVAGLLLVPAVIPPAGLPEGNQPGNAVYEGVFPGEGNDGGESVMPCGDPEEEVTRKHNL